MKPLFAMTANAVLVTLCSIGPAHAFNPQPDPPGRFGMVGIVYGQTARLNVVAVAATSGDLSPGPCRVALGFFDSGGRPLGEPAQVLLMPGNAGYLDLPAVLLSVDDRTLREQVRPLAQVLPNARGEKACSGVTATVEVFDLTGRTSVFIEDPNLLRGISDPQIMPTPFGMVGIVYGQTARLNVVAVASSSGVLSPGPCRVALGFFDSGGRPLGETAQVLVMPGNAGYIDVPAVQLSIDDRTLREQVRPLAQVLPNARGENACNGVTATVEVFDMTGRTSVFYTDPQILQGYIDPGL